MNLGGSITFNGLELNSADILPTGQPISGYVVERFEAESPTVTGYVEKTALKDGLEASDVYLGGRAFSLVVTAYGSTAGDFWDKTQALLAAFSPTKLYDPDVTAGLEQYGFSPLAFFQPTAKVAQWPTSAYPNGIPLAYYVRPLSGPSYVLERDKDGGDADEPRSKMFDFRLLARNPRKIHTTQISVGVTTVSQALTTAQYRGDYPSFPIVAITISAAGHSVFTLTIDNLSVGLNLAGQTAGGTFYWDFGTRTLWDSNYGTTSAIVKSGLIVTPSGDEGYSPVEAGTTFLMANATAVTSCQLRYHEAWA